MNHRLVEVAPERLRRWADNFELRHGVSAVESTDHHVVLTAADGCRASFEVPWPPVDLRKLPVACLARHASLTRTVLLLSVRRGGFGAAIAEGNKILVSKHGTKYVQGKTKAGGWSQQRFARRRGNQAAGVVAGAVQAVERVFSQSVVAPGDVVGVVRAGDQGLLDQTRAEFDGPLAFLSKLPQSPILQIADPRKATTEVLAARARAIRVRIDSGPACQDRGHQREQST